MTTPSDCVFCEIVGNRSPAKVRYLDEDIIVIVNRLTWVPLMLLVMPKRHMRQSDMWSSGLMPRLGEGCSGRGLVAGSQRLSDPL